MSDEHPTTDLAMQLLREGKIEECLKCLDRVVRAYPDDALAYSIMGAAYAKAGDKAMAIGAFEHALADEESPITHSNLARALEMAGRHKNAIEHYQAALHLDPGYKAAADGLSRLAPPEPTAEQPVA